MPNLLAVAAALAAYPWTRGHLIRWRSNPPQYCAVGALLRWADVKPAEIAWADGLGALAFWDRWGCLLGQVYGIPGLQSVHRIVTLNDAAESQAKAADLILDRMGHTTPMDELLSPRQLRRFGDHSVMISCEAILAYNGLPCAGAPVPLRYPLPCRQQRPWS
jgi:hypothetical protein